MWSAKMGVELTPQERDYITASIAQLERDSRLKPIVAIDVLFNATPETLRDFWDQEGTAVLLRAGSPEADWPASSTAPASRRKLYRH